MLQDEKTAPLQALEHAGDEIISRQVGHVAVPKRFTLQSREIWAMQERMTRRQGKRAMRLVEHPRFRAAYDFLLLRAQSGEEVVELAEWWTRYQEQDGEGRRAMVNKLGGSRSGRKRRRRPAKRATETGQ
jgi:poly(A) polymerase